MRKQIRLFVSMLLVLLSARLAAGQESADQEVPRKSGEPSPRPLNIVGKTLGGTQFWTDELAFHDWRIQRNVVTGHYRLLDGQQYRHAWGTYEMCSTRFAEIRRKQSLAPMKGKVVVLLHGTVRSRSSLGGMARYLNQEGGYTAVNVSYASTREKIGDHAASLKKLVDGLEGVEEINFVAHSMGNLVVRHYLGDTTDPKSGRKMDPRIRRIVMLAPPNHGARMARTFQDNDIFRLVWGVSGAEMGRNWSRLEPRLATPGCEFGVVAGDIVVYGNVGNPIFEGENDLVVSVEETRLVGASDFAVLPVSHTTIMDDARTREYTLRFLLHGFFQSADTRRPISTVKYDSKVVSGKQTVSGK